MLSVTDQNGNAITSSTHIGNLNPFRYRGYYLDTETGLYYLMSRYYDPVTHRFVNADGYFQAGDGILDANMSAYCGNNPVMRADPSGEIWNFFEALFNGIGRAINSFATAYAGCGSLAAADGPLPFGDIACAVGAGALTLISCAIGIHDAFQETSGSKSKADEKTEITEFPSDSQYNYYSATIQNGFVTPITPLTYSQAREWVSAGNNLLCRNRSAAYAIAKFYPSAFWEPAHNKDASKCYLNHYHLNSAHTNHIWFYGE